MVRPTTLTSLAILKVNWDEKGHDYADNFLPFIHEAVLQQPDDHVSVNALQKAVRDAFGLIIPQGALNTLLRRAERRGLVKRAQGVFVRDHATESSDFQARSAEALRRQDALLKKLADFAKERYELSWSHAEAETALLRHLQSSCVPILAAATDGCPIPPMKKAVPHEDFVVNAFTVFLFESDPEGFAFLDTVSKGNILATALFVPEIGKADKRFQNLTIYLDTQIILRALGLEGEGLREPAEEFLALLYEMGVDLACFNITLDELRGILDAAQNALRDPQFLRKGHFSVFEYFISEGWRASDVELVIASLERSLKRLHINVKERPFHEVELTLNETRLMAILHDELPGQKEEAQRHDVDCITAIHRLRRGRPKSEIETCGYIFVTTNNALARASARYFIEEHERLTVPLCINDHTMATLAWVKNPKLQQDWARKKLVADSLAALRPNAELWKKYMNEISRLQENREITDEEYQLLRFSQVARNALMDSTLGSPDAFTAGTAQEILQVATANLRRDLDEQLVLEKSERAKIAAELDKKNRQVEMQRAQHRAQLRDAAAALGTWARRAMVAASLSVILFGVWYTLPSPLGPSTAIASWIVPGALLLFAGLSVWNLFSGGTAQDLARGFELKVTGAAEALFLSRFDLHDAEDVPKGA